MSLLTGKTQSSVARVVNRLAGRLLSDDYITVVRYKDSFTPKELAIAYDRFVLGLSVRSIALRRKLNKYQVYKTINYLRKQIETLTQRKMR